MPAPRSRAFRARSPSKIKAAQMQASDQITILEQGKATNGSDFYSYRYLATEGFLPGYNFPRLPLYAFIPGEGKTGSFLQRARFLAISEFGPRSLIYHEGRAYRVMKAKLPPEVRTGDGAELATRDIFICSNCGACHDGEVERCHACNTPMAGEMPVQRTLRIDNVEAAPAERITANDEERVRQGFDIQTVFSWPKRERPDSDHRGRLPLRGRLDPQPAICQQRRDQPDQQRAETAGQPDSLRFLYRSAQRLLGEDRKTKILMSMCRRMSLGRCGSSPSSATTRTRFSSVSATQGLCAGDDRDGSACPHEGN